MTQAELFNYIDAIMAQMNQPKWTDDKKQLLFIKMDKDRNGVITINELKEEIRESLIKSKK